MALGDRLQVCREGAQLPLGHAGELGCVLLGAAVLMKQLVGVALIPAGERAQRVGGGGP